MNNKVRSSIRSNTRLFRDLLNVLEYGIDNLKTDLNNGDVASLIRTMQDTNETLQNLIDVMAEIEYTIYLNSLEES